VILREKLAIVCFFLQGSGRISFGGKTKQERKIQKYKNRKKKKNTISTKRAFTRDISPILASLTSIPPVLVPQIKSKSS
jgi:hypothetical protein